MTVQNYQRLILGYHGCDEDICQKVLGGQEVLEPSNNKWDWLGKGVYFWEYGPERALHFAKEQKERKQKIGQPFGTPAVLGAIIHLGYCFDLFDLRFTRMLQDAHRYFVHEQGNTEQPLPRNHPDGRHELDCAVFNYMFSKMEQEGQRYQTVRGIFVEGTAVYTGTKICEKTHIQIAVRDPDCIVGFFRPSVAKEGI